MTGSPPGSREGVEAAVLDAELRRLHGTARPAELSALHERAAALLPGAGARRFHLTHAWVFALEAGEETRAGALEARLRAAGGL